MYDGLSITQQKEFEDICKLICDSRASRKGHLDLADIRDEMLPFVQVTAESAHADGCRETIERAMQPVEALKREIELFGKNAKTSDGRKASELLQEMLTNVITGLHALAPSQVKEGPTLIVDAHGPSFAENVSARAKVLAVQPSDAAEREPCPHYDIERDDDEYGNTSYDVFGQRVNPEHDDPRFKKIRMDGDYVERAFIATIHTTRLEAEMFVSAMAANRNLCAKCVPPRDSSTERKA